MLSEAQAKLAEAQKKAAKNIKLLGKLPQKRSAAQTAADGNRLKQINDYEKVLRDDLRSIEDGMTAARARIQRLTKRRDDLDAAQAWAGATAVATATAAAAAAAVQATKRRKNVVPTAAPERLKKPSAAPLPAAPPVSAAAAAAATTTTRPHSVPTPPPAVLLVQPSSDQPPAGIEAASDSSRSRSCPRCTLRCDDPHQARCSLCNSMLPSLAPAPAGRSDRGSKKRPRPTSGATVAAPATAQPHAKGFDCCECGEVLDDEAGEVMTASIGCDAVGCSRWACLACAGFQTEAEAEAGSYLCPQHSTSEAAAEEEAAVEEAEAKEEEDDLRCRVCDRPDKEEQMILCGDGQSGCDAPYHIFCLDPPLSRVPETDWYCHECDKARGGTAGLPPPPPPPGARSVTGARVASGRARAAQRGGKRKRSGGAAAAAQPLGEVLRALGWLEKHGAAFEAQFDLWDTPENGGCSSDDVQAMRELWTEEEMSGLARSVGLSDSERFELISLLKGPPPWRWGGAPPAAVSRLWTGSWQLRS